MKWARKGSEKGQGQAVEGQRKAQWKVKKGSGRSRTGSGKERQWKTYLQAEEQPARGGLYGRGGGGLRGRVSSKCNRSTPKRWHAGRVRQGCIISLVPHLRGR